MRWIASPCPVRRDAILTHRKDTKMKVDEVKQLTNKALDELVAALESGHSESFIAYLKTMSLSSKYSLNNLFLIGEARARWSPGGRFSHLTETRTRRPQMRKRNRCHCAVSPS